MWDTIIKWWNNLSIEEATKVLEITGIVIIGFGIIKKFIWNKIKENIRGL